MTTANSSTPNSLSLGSVISDHRQAIFDELVRRLARLPQSAYQQFSQSKAGYQRIRDWIDNILKAVAGEPEIFLADTERIGYLRAHQGFELDFIIEFYRTFKQIVWEILQGLAAERKADLAAFSRDLHQLNDILFQGLRVVTFSYLKTREDIINEKVNLQQRLLEEIEHGRQEKQLLAGKIITIQEEERKRLAGEIHDTITQALTGIGFKTQYCQELYKTEPERIPDQLNRLLDTVDAAIDQSRAIMSSLRPDLIDTLGLIPALQRHIEKFSQETGIRVKAQFPADIQLSSEITICLFRMVQEALMNVYKHAGTREAEVSLTEAGGAVYLRVSDHGRGFDRLQGISSRGQMNKMGILILKERIESVGGQLTIAAGDHRGCRLKVKIPLNAGMDKPVAQ